MDCGSTSTFFTVRCYASVVCAVACVCQSVSLTSLCCSKIAKHTGRITQTRRHNSLWVTLVLRWQRFRWNLNRVVPNGGAQYRWRYVKSDFRPISRNILETVQDREVVTTKGKWELVYAVSNGTISIDIQLPLTTPNYPIFCICINFPVFIMGGPRDFKFGT